MILFKNITFTRVFTTFKSRHGQQRRVPCQRRLSLLHPITWNPFSPTLRPYGDHTEKRKQMRPSGNEIALPDGLRQVHPTNCPETSLQLASPFPYIERCLPPPQHTKSSHSGELEIPYCDGQGRIDFETTRFSTLVTPVKNGPIQCL